MNKRWNRTIALLLVVLLLLSGCGTPQSTETTEEAPVGSVADVVDTDSNTTFLDFCRTTDGYAVLARTASGIEISELDAGLHETEKNQVDIEEAFAIAEGGGHRWIVVMSEGSKVEILCDESTWLQTGISGYLYQSQLVWEQDTLYSVLNRSLWIGQTKVELPEDGSGKQYQVYCVVKVGNQLYALVTVSSGGEAAGQWLCPIDKTTTKLTLLEQSFPLRAKFACWNEDTAWMLYDSMLYRTDGSSCDSVCDLSASGVEVEELLRILPGDNGTFYALQKNGILRIDPNAAQEAKTLTMGVYTLYTDCDPAIAAFNREGTGWRIRAKYYNDIETMNLAILNGELDLICSLDEGIMHNYASKGLLVPIDPSLTDQVLPNIVAACSERGSCWYLPRGMLFACAKIPSNCVDDPADLKDLKRLVADMDRYCPYVYDCFTKEAILDYLLQNVGDGWVDWNSRTANFTGEEFLAVLDFINHFENSQATANANMYEAEQAGRQIFLINYQIRLDRYHVLRSYDADTSEEAWYFFPFPVGDCSGFAIRQNGFYAAVQGKNKAGTDAFLNFLFSDDNWFDKPEDLSKRKYDIPYPVNTKHCEELLNIQIEAYFNDPYCDTTGLKEASAEWLEELKRADHFCFSWSNEINDIITEEAKPYFNGDISADEAARRIQNRVEIYLAERG